MEKEAIEKWIEEYIENTIHITVDKKISLLDPRNGMLPRDLLQLYFAVESYFGIKFEERNVIDASIFSSAPLSNTAIFNLFIGIYLSSNLF